MSHTEIRALVVTAPGRAEIQLVPEPVATANEVVVDVHRAGICGTDVELFTGEMAYFESGHTSFPVRLGHEWMGVVSQLGEGVDPSWLGERVTGDTMMGCGSCRRCTRGKQHLCDTRGELGIRDGRPGALAEKVAVPVSSLRRLPENVSDVAGALVEPGGNAYRAVEAAALSNSDRCLIIGPGTIGVLCAMFARAAGADVHLVGVDEASVAFARELGFSASSAAMLPALPWDAIIDASNDRHSPARAIDLAEPGGRVVCIGLSSEASLIDTRQAVLKDVTLVGVLSASPGLDGAIASYAAGSVDPTPLVAASVPLEDLPRILAGQRPEGRGPKIQVAPQQ